MFNLDNIELDFDDDFSLNIFSKKTSSNRENEGEKGKAQEKKDGPKNKIVNSFNKISEQSKPQSQFTSESFINFPLRNVSGENCLKRPCEEMEKPQRKRLSHEGLLQRKFPGPAGLLPDKPFKEISDVSLLMKEPQDESSEKEKPVIYSQCSGSVFLDSGYQKLVSEFGLNDADNPLNRYTVEWVKRTALNKGLQGRKIPFLGVVVHAVNHSMPDPVLVLRDPTGEISGSLHREVWAEMGGKLRTGIALALRQVGVLITGVIRRQIYLNVTMNNILAVYSPSASDAEVEVTTVNKASKSELCRNFAEWLAPPKPSPVKAPPPPCFPFTTIDSPRTTDANKNGTRVLDDLGIVFSDDDFNDEIKIPQNNRDIDSSVKSNTSGRALSPQESQIFEEVLSGIDLDEFEM